MKQYISRDKSKSFNKKTTKIRELINTALYFLETFGIPMDATPRRLERMAIAFLASGDVTKSKDFKSIKDLNSGYALKTREIIEFVNKHFRENISQGLMMTFAEKT